MLEKARCLDDQFAADLAARETMISGDVGNKALDAARHDGKIVNHPAKLNMGDCFAYACAKAHRLRLADKGTIPPRSMWLGCGRFFSPSEPYSFR